MYLKIINISLAILLLFVYAAIPVWASAESLQNATDQLQIGTPAINNVEHYITFTIPPDGTAEISPANYLLIQMPNFENIDISKIGVTGTFVYGDNTGLHAVLNGHTIIITNLSILPGSTIHITGIKALNPNSPSQYNEEVIFSTDSGGISPIYKAQFLADQAASITSATATIQPDTAEVSLSGYASPDFFITITENNAVLGTTATDGTGYFQMLLTGLTPGVHNFTVYGIDSNNNATTPNPISLYAPSYQVTNIDNITLSPVIYASPSQVQQTDTLHITGEAIPNSTIVISINSPLTQITATSDGNGNFSYDFSPANLQPGQYQASAIVETQNSDTSLSSPTINFTVLNGGSNPQQPSCDITKGDLNCDGIVNIEDFSILLYYWGTNSALADINADGIVNLQDFSIMMFYFNQHV